MTLSDAGIRAAKPKDKTFKLADGGGLYLEVSPQGSKLWRMKYRFEGKEKRLAFGVYPDVPLAGRKHAETGLWIDGARDKREAARQLLASGVDPGEQKKIIKAARDGRHGQQLRDRCARVADEIRFQMDALQQRPETHPV